MYLPLADYKVNKLCYSGIEWPVLSQSSVGFLYCNYISKDAVTRWESIYKHILVNDELK